MWSVVAFKLVISGDPGAGTGFGSCVLWISSAEAFKEDDLVTVIVADVNLEILQVL